MLIRKTKTFQRKLRKLPPSVREEIQLNIKRFTESPEEPPDDLSASSYGRNNKSIKKKYGRVMRFKPHKDYRIIYTVSVVDKTTHEKALNFVFIGHRKDIYVDFEKTMPDMPKA